MKLVFTLLLGTAVLAGTAGAQPVVRPVSGAGTETVEIDVARFEAAARAAQPVALEVLGRHVVTAPERVVWRGAGRFTWFGTVEGGGRATLTVEGAHVLGRIATPDGVVMVEPAGAGHRAYAAAAPPPQTVATDALPLPPGEGAGPGASAGPDTEELFPDELHLALFYTPAVAAALGDGLAVYLQSAEDVLNDVLANSGVTGRVRVVHHGETAYTESGTLVTDLSRLFNINDGYLEEAPGLRFRYGADAVALLVEAATDGCGIAYLMDPLSATFPGPYSVIVRSCAVTHLALPHEVGHTLGLRHDGYVDAAVTPFPYSHGFVNTTALDPASGRPGVRTVLAYDDACTALGGTCVHVPYYSDPGLTFAGQVLGDAATAHNARAADAAFPVATTLNPMARAASVAGDTDGEATWTPPVCPDPADLSSCTPGPAAPYVAVSFRSLSSFPLIFYTRVEAGADGVLLLYRGAFDPAAPLANLVGYATPDPTAPPSRRHLLPHVWGEFGTYVAVVTGAAGRSPGPFTLDLFTRDRMPVLILGADEEPPPLPAVLEAPQPNPFRGSTQFTVQVGAPESAVIAVYDALGRRVAVLYEGRLVEGRRVFTFDGAGLAPGAYVIRVHGERLVASARVTLLP